MTTATLTRIVALGSLTGVRSMAGLATLAWARGGAARAVMSLAVLGEAVADKTPRIGNRTDAVPLAGRAAMGAAAGALVAWEADDDLLLGAVVGAATAVAVTHLAFQVRTRLPLPSVAGGLLEDALVAAVASRAV